MSAESTGEHREGDGLSEGWPLAGLRVVDLSTEIAGPYCSKLLVDAGANVIKVEDSRGGDPLRRWTASGSEIPSDEDGALFQFLNASKRSIALDLDSDAGRDELTALAASADLVIESAAPGGLRKLGLDWARLQEANPRVCLVSISPWGLEGPFADRPATEFTLQAATGSIDYRGLRDRKPAYAGGRIGEWAAGAFAAVGALSAWLSARHTGSGQHVDVSMFEAMVLSLTVYHDLNSQWFVGPLPRSIEIPSIERARDGWVGFCTITGQQWTDFCAMVGRQDIAEDERFLDAKLRMEHLEMMKEMIEAWTRERSVEEIIEVAGLLRIPAAPIGDGRTLPRMDHMIERGVFEKSPGGFIQPRPPYRLGGAPPRPFGPAPRLGEHTQSIREELASRKAAGAGASGVAPAGGGGETSARPLEGLRVVDMSAFWAGPIAGTYLADMGADVVKLESIQRPDGMRFAGAVRNDRMWEWSPVFHGANPGKRGITLRLDDERGMAQLHRLIEGADVLIENFSARVMENFGLGWEQVREINPKIVMVRMQAFGLSGPWRDRAGFAMSVEQVSGLAWLTGYADMPLVVRGACDPIGGMHAVFALLAALERRRQTGEGLLVELPLVEVAVNVAAEQVIEHSAYGALLSRHENRGPVSAPQGIYACADQQNVAIAVQSDAQWSALCELMGSPEWALAPELEGAPGRRARHDEIDARLDAWLEDQPAERAAAQLCAAGVPAAVAINPHSLMPNPQLEHRQFFQVIDHPCTGETRYPGFPMAFSALPRALHRRPPPTLGQHNREVLGDELGLSEQELEALAADQITGDKPSFM